MSGIEGLNRSDVMDLCKRTGFEEMVDRSRQVEANFAIAMSGSTPNLRMLFAGFVDERWLELKTRNCSVGLGALSASYHLFLCWHYSVDSSPFYRISRL